MIGNEKARNKLPGQITNGWNGKAKQQIVSGMLLHNESSMDGTNFILYFSFLLHSVLGGVQNLDRLRCLRCVAVVVILRCIGQFTEGEFCPGHITKAYAVTAHSKISICFRLRPSGTWYLISLKFFVITAEALVPGLR